MPVIPSQDGYTIRGIAPPGLAARPASERRLFWGWVVELGLKAKDRDLSRGLDRDGRPLRPIAARTRKYRRSAMTPSGKGDPNAPPLTPAHEKSRTRSLLTGRAEADRAEFWWRFDPWTGQSWARVLEFQARRGRDVFGLSKAAVAWTRRLAVARWERYQAGRAVKAPKVPVVRQAPARIAAEGSFDYRHATFGIGASGPEGLKRGSFSGLRTHAELVATLRAPARVTIPGRSGTNHNRVLEQVWGSSRRPPAMATPRAATPRPIAPRPLVPPGPARPRVASTTKTAKAAPRERPDLSEIKRTRLFYSGSNAAAAIRTASEMTGHPVGPWDLIELAGALPGTTVDVENPNETTLILIVRSRVYSFTGRLDREPDEKLVFTLSSVEVARKHRGQGIVTAAFARQLEECRKLGVDRIELIAARNDDPKILQIGYKVWPKYGFDGEIRPNYRARLPSWLRGARFLHDVLATERGRRWWDEHGWSIALDFDMTPGSRSWRTWNAHRARKGR